MGLPKSFQIYFSKFKKPIPHLQNPPNHTATTSWILSACKYPKTPSFTIDRHQSDDKDGAAATLTDIDRFLFENFNSLYISDINGCDVDDDGDKFSGFSTESPRYLDPPPYLRPSKRFFVSPGTSSSLIEEARLSASTDELARSDVVGPVVPNDTVVVVAYSKDPYDDFLRSMQEVIEVRHGALCQPLDWDFVEELLFCYLKLNEKKTHKYILGAFANLMSVLSQDSNE